MIRLVSCQCVCMQCRLAQPECSALAVQRWHDNLTLACFDNALLYCDHNLYVYYNVTSDNKEETIRCNMLWSNVRDCQHAGWWWNEKKN